MTDGIFQRVVLSPESTDVQVTITRSSLGVLDPASANHVYGHFQSFYFSFI